MQAGADIAAQVPRGSSWGVAYMLSACTARVVVMAAKFVAMHSLTLEVLLSILDDIPSWKDQSCTTT